MTRAFDDYLMAALGQPVTNLALCVRIVRQDGTRILFAQASEALTTLDENGAQQTFAPARGVTVTTIPFELNGATTRVDLNVISTDGGTIDVSDIENGLYDNAAVTITLASRDTQAPLFPTPATGSIFFTDNPPNDQSGTLNINGQTIRFYTVDFQPVDVAVQSTLAETLADLAAFLNASTNPDVYAATYSVDPTGTILQITANGTQPFNDFLGAAGNSFVISANLESNAYVTSLTLTGGADLSPQPPNVLFSGLMGTMTLTERGYATIEMVGLLERAKQFVTEVFTPVCRADFGDARCKVDLNGVDALGNLITQHCKVTGYDGGYKITVDGLNDVALNATGAKASGKITFGANPATSAVVAGQTAPLIILNGTGLSLWDITTPTDAAYGQAGASVVAETLAGTLLNLLNFLTTSKDPNLARMAYNVDATTLYVTAASEGTAGNALTLGVGTWTPATASGPTLTGGIGAGLALGNYFLNGQVIFRSGLLLNEAYEIQASEGNVISLFTPLEFAPEHGDMVDVLQGCDHSPFAGGLRAVPRSGHWTCAEHRKLPRRAMGARRRDRAHVRRSHRRFRLRVSRNRSDPGKMVVVRRRLTNRRGFGHTMCPSPPRNERSQWPRHQINLR